ncbi:MAG: biotin synthase BioB [Bacteriovoracaceae bacterium]|nr:biotin synthase BioB [Bacteriovoracaceae bacterium]
MNKWTHEKIQEIFHRPIPDLIYKAQSILRENFPKNTVQINKLISIKTGQCPEDCSYCPQSARYNTDINKGTLEESQILEIAEKAIEQNVSKVCLGAAWREVKDGREFDSILKIIKKIKSLKLEVCCTLGMLNSEQAKKLKEAGLDIYNHNIDTSPQYYNEIIGTRSFQQRIDTIKNVRNAGLSVCSGGIIGMGEKDEDIIEMIKILANMSPQPESVPINALVATEGTPLQDMKKVSIWKWVRTIATARITLPKTFIRLAAGRYGRTQEEQTLCLLAGANSIFTGEQLLTSKNELPNKDYQLFKDIGLKPLRR